MASKWFDGTYTYPRTTLDSTFPVMVTDSLRLSADGKRLAVINHTEDGSFLNDFSEPDFQGEKPFYHVSFQADAGRERSAIGAFIKNGNHHEKKEGSFNIPLSFQKLKKE